MDIYLYSSTVPFDHDHSLTLFDLQASCSRAQAVQALKKNDMDIVNAIMELTMD